MTGTSTSTSTTVARAAPDRKPKMAMRPQIWMGGRSMLALLASKTTSQIFGFDLRAMAPIQGKAGGVFGGGRNEKDGCRIGAIYMEILDRRLNFARHGISSVQSASPTARIALTSRSSSAYRFRSADVRRA